MLHSLLLLLGLTASSHAASNYTPAKAYILRTKAGPVSLSIYTDVMADKGSAENGGVQGIAFQPGEKLTVEAKIDSTEKDLSVRFLGDLEERHVKKAPYTTSYVFPQVPQKGVTHFIYAAVEDVKGEVRYVASYPLNLDWKIVSHLSTSSTPSIAKSLLYAAMGMRDFNRIPKFVTSKRQLNSKDENGSMPLYSPAYLGDVKLAKILIDLGAEVDYSDPRYSVPNPVITTAIQMGQKEMAMYLIERGSKPDKLFGWDPLMMSIVRQDLPEFRKLVKAPRNEVKYLWMNPIPLASAMQNPEMVKALIARGEDVNATDTKWSGGMTGLMYAARVGSVDTAKMLVNAGADASLQTGGGLTAFAEAQIHYQNETHPDKKELRDRYAQIMALLKPRTKL